MGYVWSGLVFALLLWLGITFNINTFTIHAGNLAYFVDVGALVVMVLGPLIYALLNVPREHAPLLGVLNPRRLHPEEARRLIAFFATYRDASLATGGLLALVGIVVMLQELGNPKAVGPAMALAILGLFYAGVLCALCHTALVRVGLAQRPPLPSEPSPVLEWSLYLYPVLGTIVMAILLFTLATPH